MQHWDVEFSLALHNRTGKFFIGRDILRDQSDLIDRTFYWRIPVRRTPGGLTAKVLGRALKLEQEGVLSRILPPFRPRNPLLHLDPFTVLHCALEPRDAILCHDMGPITHPELFGEPVSDLYRRAYALIAQRRPRMVFVSNATATAYHDLYGDNGDDRTIYPPIRVELGRGDDQRPVDGLDGPFLLTVGSIGRRKNQRRTLEAFAASGLAEQGVQYVLCGSQEPGADAVLAYAAGVPGVRILPYVSDAELAWLYGNAAGFVLMSLLEGFGVPVAEAIAYGLVPLVSEKSVLCEVAGDSALTAAPDDTAEIAAAMVALALMTEPERARRREELAMSIRRFTGERFAREWRAMLLEPSERTS